MTTQIRNCGSTKSALDLNIGSGDLTEANEVAALIGHRAYAAWKIVHAASAHGGTVPLNWRHLSGTDNGAARVNTPPARLSVPISARRSPLPHRPRVNPLLSYNTMSQPGY